MVAEYQTPKPRLCQEAARLKLLCDRLAAEHAARSESEAIAITHAAIRRWRARELVTTSAGDKP